MLYSHRAVYAAVDLLLVEDVIHSTKRMTALGSVDEFISQRISHIAALAGL